jgi:hypothetical protein
VNINKSLSALALIAVAGLGLTACGGTPSATATSPSVEGIGATPAAAAPAPEGPKKSPRGNIIKAIGEPAGQSDQITKKQTVNFTVNAITVDAPCTGAYPSPAENGHFVVLDVVAETLPELGESSYPKWDINPSSFQFVGASGTTFNGNLGTMGSYSCLADAEEFPMAGMGPAEKVSAKVVVDVPETTGTLVFKSLGSMSGWEWAF